jgi:hypothetical protein
VEPAANEVPGEWRELEMERAIEPHQIRYQVTDSFHLVAIQLDTGINESTE